MVNRGDGGSRRPAPPAGRPAPRPPARPSADDEEKTGAINLADVNLDDLDEAPLPVAKPASKLGSKSFVDDDNEKTNAINLADVNLDDLDEAPMPRPQPAAPGRPAPAAGRPTPAPRTPPGSSHTRPQPGRPAPRPAAPQAAADDEKTSALSLEEVERADRARPAAPAPAPAKRTAAPARPAPVDEEKTSALSLDEMDLDALDAGLHRKSAAPPPRAVGKAPAPTPTAAKPVAKTPAPPPKEPEVDKTTAVSMDDLEDKQSFARAALAKLKKEPPTADSTFLVDDEEVPFVKAPAPKKVGKATEAASSAPATGDAEPQLVVRAGPDLGKSFALTKDLTLIGRGLDADVVINDAAASRKHFNIVRTLSGWKLVDLGSGNGTKVDGNRVTELTLKHGMQIEAGGTTLEFAHEGGGRAAAAAPKGAVRETVPEPAPAPRSPTLLPTAGDDAGKPSRRAPEQKAPERKRDPSRLEKFDAKDELAGKGGGKQLPPPSDEKTSFGDIQALEIDPEWEARRLKQRREGVADVERPRPRWSRPQGWWGRQEDRDRRHHRGRARRRVRRGRQVRRARDHLPEGGRRRQARSRQGQGRPGR
ncbi:MAG: FHA domain-containing protein [Phycisphaerales bacterium]|nr:FHA domain-containing protein [Phycisphaerales bacterium]